MYKVIISKPGKRFSFQGKLYTTPCKFFANDNHLDLVKLLLRKAGINERFDIQKVVESKARVEFNKQVQSQLDDAAKRISEAVASSMENKEEEAEAEEQQQQSQPQEEEQQSQPSRKSKRNR